MHLLSIDLGAKITGEMFFYYLPKGLLRKKPINVYEVPKRFNINETEYLKTVDYLYEIIKNLKQDFVDTEQRLWTSITISIIHNKFKIEFNYDKISEEEYSSYVRHVIWRYKYLHLGGELKEERKILDKYLNNPNKKEETEVYQAGIYLKSSNNSVGFDSEVRAAQERQEEQRQRAVELEERKNKRLQEKVEKEEIKRRKEEEKNKNQILKM